MEELTPEQVLAKEENERRRNLAIYGLGQELYNTVCDNDHDYDYAKKILFQAQEWECGHIVANWINHRDPDWPEYSPLTLACTLKDLEMVKLLLSFPDIYPSDNKCRYDAVSEVCRKDDIEMLKLLLRDSDVVADARYHDRETPLASNYWRVEVIKWLIASRKRLTSDSGWRLALGDAKKRAEEYRDVVSVQEAVELLQSYRDDPVATTRRVRAELGVDVSDAAELYALVVLFCDGYFVTPVVAAESPASAPASAAARFFSMVSKLPMELQMMVCHRAFDSARDTVKFSDSETAFKLLGGILPLEDGWRAPSYDEDKEDPLPNRICRGGYLVRRKNYIHTNSNGFESPWE